MFKPGTIFVAAILYIIFLAFKVNNPHLADIPMPVVVALCLIAASMFLAGGRRQSYSDSQNPENQEGAVPEVKGENQKQDNSQ